MSDQDLQLLQSRALVRGHYKNVASESNGAIISNTNIVHFAGTHANSSPLRDSCHFFDKQQGYVWIEKGLPIIVDLLQTYEINTIVFRLHDKDCPPKDVQVFVINKEGKHLVYDSKSAHGLVRVQFEPTMVKQIEFLNRGSTQQSQYMEIVMI